MRLLRRPRVSRRASLGRHFTKSIFTAAVSVMLAVTTRTIERSRLGLMEDYTRSYNVDGFMWSSERQGGLTNALGARHGGATTDPGKSTCFCEFCP